MDDHHVDKRKREEDEEAGPASKRAAPSKISHAVAIRAEIGLVYGAYDALYRAGGQLKQAPSTYEAHYKTLLQAAQGVRASDLHFSAMHVYASMPAPHPFSF